MKKRVLVSMILLVWICPAIFKMEIIASEEEIQFSDENLENTIRAAIGKTSEENIYKEDLRYIWNLDLSDKDIASIEGLEYCTNLYNLYLDNNHIGDITPLSNLKKLVELGLDGNNIADISPLSALTNLKFLYLSGNTISDVSSLSHLTNLVRLSISYNDLSDISALSSLVNLTELYLCNNAISDITTLSFLTNLRELDLSNNTIHDIFPLFSLTDLRGLNLQRNNITDITQIKGIIRIGNHEERWIGSELDLSHNQIADITPLIENPGINEGDSVDISNNPLNAISIERYIPRLERRGVNLTWKPIKENFTPGPANRSQFLVVFLVAALLSIVILYGMTKKKSKRRSDEETKLKKLLEEENRLKNLLNELKFCKEELMSRGILEEKYNKMCDHISERLIATDELIKKIRKE